MSSKRKTVSNKKVVSKSKNLSKDSRKAAVDYSTKPTSYLKRRQNDLVRLIEDLQRKSDILYEKIQESSKDVVPKLRVQKDKIDKRLAKAKKNLEAVQKELKKRGETIRLVVREQVTKVLPKEKPDLKAMIDNMFD